LLCILCSVTTVTDAQSVRLYGVDDSVDGHVARLLNGDLFRTPIPPAPSAEAAPNGAAADSAAADSAAAAAAAAKFAKDCDDAHKKALGPKTAEPAKDRYAAAKTYRACVENARSSLLVLAPARAATTTVTLQPLEASLAQAETEAKAEATFMGISFGVGVGASISDDDRISAAEVGADGRIRATSTETQEPRVIFESHYYGWCHSDECNAGHRGVGPFFGIVAKDDKLISAFALGVMFGRKSDEGERSEGFSVGIGAILDSDVKSLADGFKEGQPLPPGETQISFEEKSRWGALLFFTRTF